MAKGLPGLGGWARLAVAATLMAAAAPAQADKILNPTAVFSGLDKITGRIIAFEVAMDETVQFGSLQITPRVCISRPPKEAPLTDGFIEVDEVGENKQFKRIFSGWMFAASPGLHGVEHPVYDVWVTDCKGGTEIVATASNAPSDPPPNADVLANTGREPRPKQTSRRATDGLRAGQDPSGAPPPVPGATAQDGPRQRRSPSQSFFPTAQQSTAVPRPLPVDPAGR